MPKCNPASGLQPPSGLAGSSRACIQQSSIARVRFINKASICPASVRSSLQTGTSGPKVGSTSSMGMISGFSEKHVSEPSFVLCLSTLQGKLVHPFRAYRSTVEQHKFPVTLFLLHQRANSIASTLQTGQFSFERTIKSLCVLQSDALSDGSLGTIQSPLPDDLGHHPPTASCDEARYTDVHLPYEKVRPNCSLHSAHRRDLKRIDELPST